MNLVIIFNFWWHSFSLCKYSLDWDNCIVLKWLPYSYPPLCDMSCTYMCMFILQYSLGVKRDEMRKLEEIAAAEEKKLELAEQYLEEDAAMFDEFLKENDKNSVEAIKMYAKIDALPYTLRVLSSCFNLMTFCLCSLSSELRLKQRQRWKKLQKLRRSTVRWWPLRVRSPNMRTHWRNISSTRDSWKHSLRR